MHCVFFVSWWAVHFSLVKLVLVVTLEGKEATGLQLWVVEQGTKYLSCV